MSVCFCTGACHKYGTCSGRNAIGESYWLGQRINEWPSISKTTAIKPGFEITKEPIKIFDLGKFIIAVED